MPRVRGPTCVRRTVAAAARRLAAFVGVEYTGEEFPGFHSAGAPGTQTLGRRGKEFRMRGFGGGMPGMGGMGDIMKQVQKAMQ